VKPHDVETFQDAASGCHMGGIGNGADGWNKGSIYLIFCNFLVQLESYGNFDSHTALWWIMKTKWHSLHPAKPLCTSIIWSLKM
jgi:hypothetical protein